MGYHSLNDRKHTPRLQLKLKFQECKPLKFRLKCSPRRRIRKKDQWKRLNVNLACSHRNWTPLQIFICFLLHAQLSFRKYANRLGDPVGAKYVTFKQLKFSLNDPMISKKRE